MHNDENKQLTSQQHCWIGWKSWPPQWRKTSKRPPDDSLLCKPPPKKWCTTVQQLILQKHTTPKALSSNKLTNHAWENNTWCLLYEKSSTSICGSQMFEGNKMHKLLNQIQTCWDWWQCTGQHLPPACRHTLLCGKLKLPHFPVMSGSRCRPLAKCTINSY